MKSVKEEMIEIFKPNKYDWMNYLIEDDLTYHHIKKAEDGGEKTIDNGALLTSRAHAYLHKIEGIDYEIYLKLNKIFKEINNKKREPTKIQRKKIQLLLMKFEICNADKLIKRKEHIISRIRKKVAIKRRKEIQKYE